MESVWDYPRPPAVEHCERRVRVELEGVTIADSSDALRVLETAGPPTIYVPPDDVATDHLQPVDTQTVCEWKGRADHFDVVVGERRAEAAAWSYPQPAPGYETLRDHFAFYAGRVDACYLDDERVVPQPGRYYGGWITSDIRGPFKGEPGTSHW